ncbi:MAG: hypothetical protein A2W93_08775 [Bacteroidetes bacterium GWF2_43_63]|nr:MAG: hypothetical protein A2W94_03020 [Bacteroidetes bacterium GWE2_42_42]OFY55223.1 MAG: hypothetical protein A2W93_08775 [Bacteroidetes bacterium GWF2_43_63]HBG70898.1 hypothetical protein [Bacteroidales bacterium]HCB63338.1 hypothetical protein [Bacteroidales bacterium]HCY23041.1 hypothetical protein [Bacteroidales bacterium]
MKSVMKFFVLMIVSSSLMLSGCKKDDDEVVTPTTTYTNVLSAKIDGIQFTASMPLAQMTMGFLQIGGSNAAGSIQVILSYDVPTGTVTVTSGSEEAVYWDSGAESYWPGTGSIVVSKHDQTNNIIEGTFTASLEEFSSSEVISVSNGVFKISYIEH